MTAPTPYLQCPGNARELLTFYADVFDATPTLHTLEDFNRTDGPPDAIAHGYLSGGAVELFAADITGDEVPFRCQGMLFSLLGTAPPSTLRQWFSRLADGGEIIDDLQVRPWGASDGQVTDRYGLTWVIGFEVAENT